jgi:hypothetical protein
VSYPSRACGWNSDGRVWGKFDVADASCSANLRFETPKQDHCVGDGVRQWSAIITGDNYTGDWVAACAKTSATIGSATYAAHGCAKNADTRVWGLFDVPDASCGTRLWFEDPRRGDCLESGKREYSAIITGQNYDGDWAAACRTTQATIDGRNYASRDCASNADTRVWGKFDVEDASCHVRVRGVISYRDFDPRFSTDASGVKSLPSTTATRPVRRARVEIWYGSSPSRKYRATTTADDGSFETFVQQEDLTNYRAIVVASNPAGQVNLRDNTASWYYTPEHMLMNHPDGDGFVVESAAGLVLSDPTGDAMSFNALDALLVARDYAVSHGVPAERLKPVSVVPSTSEITPHTVPSGEWSLIWAPDNAKINYLFHDQTIMHEYAHHIERMNDTYALWPSTHNGCYVTIGTLDPPPATGACGFAPLTYPDQLRNSDEMAWFEAFPKYFSIVEGQSALDIVEVDGTPTYHPAVPMHADACECPAATVFGPSAVEDYVASMLFDFVNSNNVVLSNGSAPATRAELERHVLDLFFNQISSVRTPGDGMPRVGDFRNLWDLNFPDSAALDQLMDAYGMLRIFTPEMITGETVFAEGQILLPRK